MFQPHESHIPYILRFFIDFNLCGMGYIHVPMNKVHTRSIGNDSRYKKKSVSNLEVDFSGAFILNRTELLENNAASQKAANMGIESIWEDERRRRMQNSQELPELKTQEDEPRICDPTSSEIFFLRALKERYLNSSDGKKSEESSTTTLDESAFKKKFDLRNYLEATTYGAEFSQSSGSSNQPDEMDVTLSMDISQTVEELESHFLNTQRSGASTSKEVNDILSIAENEDDFDSLLAPFSQTQHSGKTTQSDINEQLDASQIRHFFEEFDAEDESEFNMTLADLEIAMLDDENNEIIPQLDGVDDEIDSKMISGPSKKFIKTETENPNDFQDNLHALMSHFNQETSVKKEVEEIKSSSESDSDDEQMKSFYDQTLLTNDFVDENLESPEVAFKSESESNVSTEIPIKIEPVDGNKPCVITLAYEPPDPNLVLDKLQDFDIPNTVNKYAFYSNPADVTDKKEVGYNILEIHSDKLNDCEDFKSTIFSKNQLKHFQAQKLSYHLGFMPKSIAHTTDLIDDNSDVIIHPIKEPPTYNDAKKWLQTGIEETESQKVSVLEDSPVKVKRVKTNNVLETDGEIKEELSEDLDKTLIPQSPEVKNEQLVIPSSLEKDSPTLSEFVEDGIYLSYSARKKRRRRAKKTFSERFQEIMKAKVGSTSGIEQSQTFSESSQSSMDNEKMSDSSEDLLKDSQSNSSNTKLSDDTFTCSVISDANIPLNDSYEASTMSETFGFKMKLESLQSTDEHNDLTILSMELHVQTKGDFNPNPETDEIVAIFYCIEGYYVNEQATSSSGIILVCEPNDNLGYFKEQIEVIKVKNELELLEEFFKKIRMYDPDIFAGYEIELLSWGYLFERGFVLNMNLCNALSRMPLDKEPKVKIMHEEDDNDQGDYNTEQKIPGRIMLDVWRLMRHEIALTSYSFENIAYHILHRR